MTPKQFGSKLKRVINRDDVLDLLAEGDWGQGGCWILAEALANFIGHPAELYAIVNKYGPQHVVVKYEDLYIDRDGVQTKDELLEHAREDLIDEPFDVVRFTNPLQVDARKDGIPCTPGVVRRLMAVLRKEFQP